MRETAATALAMLALLAGCSGEDRSAEPPVTPGASTSSASPSPSTSPSTSPSARPTTSPTGRATRTERADPRWRFYTADRRRYSSPWFAGQRRIMIGYGCNTAPWYSADPRCPDRQGFHHGIDVAMPCGTPLYAGVAGVVLDRDAPGSPGAAYGEHAFRIRTGDVDVLIGHTRRPLVDPGERLRVGQPIARAGDSAAPDGCHLHFEVRRTGGGVSAATDPAAWLRLRAGATRR